jgi:hypothetical protein
VADASHIIEAVKRGITLIDRQGDQSLERLFEHLQQGTKVGFIICEAKGIAASEARSQ